MAMLAKRQKSLNDIVAEKCLKRRLSFEENQMEKLEDIVLEFCARNFKDVFIQSTDREGRLILKKNISLPPMVFESVQKKAAHMAMHISPDLLKNCFRFRDSLYWQDIDLSHSEHDGLTAFDLKKIAQNKVAVRKLSFNSISIPPDTMDVNILRFAPLMEHLEIRKCLYVSKKNAKPIVTDEVAKVKMPKLLYLNLSFYYLALLFNSVDIKSFSNTLRVLKVYNYYDATHHSHFLAMYRPIALCTKLTTLSIVMCTFSEKVLLRLVDAIKLQRELLALNLVEVKVDSERKIDLADLILALPKLKRLDVSRSDFCLKNTRADLFASIRLKFLGTYLVPDRGFLQLKADVLATHGSLEGLLNYCLECSNYNVYNVRLIEDLLAILATAEVTSVDREQWKKIEYLLMATVIQEPFMLEYVEQCVKVLQDFPYWSADFFARLTRFHICCSV